METPQMTLIPQHSCIPGSDDDDAFSFGDAMLVDDCLVDSTVDKSNNDKDADQNRVPGQAERHANDMTTITAVPFVHSETCGPSELIARDDKGSVETPAVCTVSKTPSKLVENEEVLCQTLPS